MSHKDWDLADLLTVLEALCCMQPISNTLPLPFLIACVKQSHNLSALLLPPDPYIYCFFLQHIVELPHMLRLSCTCRERSLLSNQQPIYFLIPKLVTISCDLFPPFLSSLLEVRDKPGKRSVAHTPLPSMTSTGVGHGVF